MCCGLDNQYWATGISELEAHLDQKGSEMLGSQQANRDLRNDNYTLHLKCEGLENEIASLKTELEKVDETGATYTP